MFRSDETGVGSVEAYQSVLVRARVDGTLMQVPVTEGQEVKKGDLLAVIDPRPYQAALDQATAKKAQDEAQLAKPARPRALPSLSTRTSPRASRSTPSRRWSTATAAVMPATSGDRGGAAQLSYCYITSPIRAASACARSIPGNMVHAGDATGIVTMTQIHPISVLFTLPQESLPASARRWRADRCRCWPCRPTTGPNSTRDVC